MIPAAADCFWASAISRTRMYEVEVYHSVTNPMSPDQRLSKVIKGTVLPTNCSVACAMFTVGCGQKQQFWTIQAEHRARVVTDVPMSSQVIQVIPHVVGLTFSEPGHRLTG